MAGQIKRMLDSIIEKRAKGDPLVVLTTTAKLALKGVDPNRFNSASPDDPAVVEKVKAIASELGVSL